MTSISHLAASYAQAAVSSWQRSLRTRFLSACRKAGPVRSHASCWRLAVDQEYAGQGLGWELIRNALLRAVRLSESIGAAAVLVHCRDDSAKSFNLHHGNFLQSPVDDLHLLVPIKALRRYVD